MLEPTLRDNAVLVEKEHTRIPHAALIFTQGFAELGVVLVKVFTEY